jgi:hypothetical protein
MFPQEKIIAPASRYLHSKWRMIDPRNTRHSSSSGRKSGILPSSPEGFFGGR